MEVFRKVTGLLGVNSYFLTNGQDTVVVDGGENYSAIIDFCAERKLRLNALLLTHAHFDHAGNAARIQRNGAKVYVGAADAQKLLTGIGTLDRRFEVLTPDVIVNDGDAINVCGMTFKVLATPGHTEGSVTYMTDDVLFTGDTLFCGTYGRTDFSGGNQKDMFESLKKLFAIKGDYKVYPGHGDITTLDEERGRYSF